MPPEKVYEDYCKLDMTMETNDKEFDPIHGIDVDQLSEDVMTAYETIEKIDDIPSVNAGRLLDMIFDKNIGLYKEEIENFAPECNDKYFMNVLERELETYKRCHKDNSNG